MALTIRRDVPAGGLAADRRLYLSLDRAKLVEENDSAAAYLLATQGYVIPVEECQRLGLALVDGRVVQPGEEPAPEPKPKKKAKE